MFLRRAITFAAVVAGLFGSGCNSHAQNTAQNAPLAAVTAAPVPSRPPLIAALSPLGDTTTVAQVRVIFTDDVIPLEQLESPGEDAILAHFSLVPALPGHFRFLTPRMIGFEADRAWPGATRVRVTIAKGLRGLHGAMLDQDVSWTFQTPAIALSDLPSATDDPTSLAPQITITSNLPLDRASLAAHAALLPRGNAAGAIPLAIPPDTATAAPSVVPNPDSDYDPSSDSWHYVLVPVSTLARATPYDVVFDPGILPRDGNLPSDVRFSGRLRTHDALRFAGVVWSKPGRFTAGDAQLTFTTPIDPKTLGALTLTPAPPPGSTPFADIDTIVAVNSGLLAPNTTYSVTIGTGLRDTFGQSPASPARAIFRTGDLLSDLWAPSGTSLFAAGSDVQLNVVAVNQPSARATFLPLTARDVVLYPDPFGDPGPGDVLAPSAGWPALDTAAPRNVTRTITVPLRAKLGATHGALAYGVAGMSQDAPFVAAGVVQLTDLGVFAQFFPDTAIVRVNRISDGTPVAGARVAISPSQIAQDTKTAVQVCAEATTGADGSARLSGAAYAACAARDNGDNDAPGFVAVVRTADDWTYVRTDSYSGAFSGNFLNGWSSATPIARGTIFSDRALYQPGESAHVTAVGWFLVDGVLRRGVAPSYAVQLELPDGSKRDLGRCTLDAFGLASVEVDLPKSAPLGYYTVRASAGNGEQVMGTFRVAEFKPPNFKVDLTLDRTVAAPGESVHGSADNEYLFGAPLAGASTAFTVTRSQADFTPPGRDAYTFGRHWFWPDQAPDAATDVLQSTVTVDANGHSTVAVPVASTLPFAMSYEVDAETTDASNTAVADSKSFTALPSTTLIGVATGDVAIAGTPLDVSVVVTDPAGNARAPTHVHLELQSAVYTSATQIVEGAQQAVQSVSYHTVATTDVTSAAGPVTTKLTPPAPGEYRLRADLADAPNQGAESDTDLYVGGAGAAAWYSQDPNQLNVRLDRPTYKPGDTATVLVQSPFPAAELHLAVVRHGVLWETTQQVTSAAPTVKFTITPEMLPNAVVQAFLVRRGPPPKANLADQGNALARVGFAPFEVARDAKYIVASVHADGAVLSPGSSQTVRFTLTGRDHKPVAGEATLMVVNDAVLQLTGYRPPDLVKLVYDDQPISTRYADSRSALVLSTLTKPLQKGWGFGGGLSAGDEDPRVRRAFSPLAYFAGAVRTDALGTAHATFTLPDDLTTWRVMVVAATADGRFGNGETTFRTTKALVANPVLPQFARPGDRFDGGVAVTNGTSAQGTLSIDALLSGPLLFVSPAATTAKTGLETPLERITKAYRFTIGATGTGPGTATVRVHAGRATDAFEIPLDVRDADVAEAVAQTGTTQTQATVPLQVAAATPRDAGGLDVALASSLIPEITVAAQAALAGDERVAIAAASRLRVAADLAQLAARDGSDPAPARASAILQLATLAGLARGDGGFAPYWQSTASDPWDSLETLQALSRAKGAGFNVDASLLAGATKYAAAVLADPTAHAKWCSDALCKAQLRLAALNALSAAGDPRTTFLSDIDALRDQLSFADRARLARLLTAAPGYGARATSLSASLMQQVALTATGGAVSLPARYRWLDDPVVAQAEILRLALLRNADADTRDRLTRSLLALRRGGSFGCSCENAAALDALVAVAATEGNADFSATATLRGKVLATERFAGNRAPQRSVTIPQRALPVGTNDVAFAKTGSGTLHYALTYRYRVTAPAPGRLNGLRVTRIVRAANTTTALATMGLVPPAATLSLPAARVYDIEVDIITDHPVDRVAIVDPLPAGMEAIDTSFATTSAALKTPETSWAIGDQQIRTDRIEAYADHLDPGIYRLHYLARTVTPGTFTWPGAEAHSIDSPEEFGRSAVSLVTIPL